MGLFHFRNPKARSLADLFTVKLALTRVVALLTPLRLGDEFANLSAADQELRWSAAVIGYSRCFTSGRLRWNWRHVLAQLDDLDNLSHKYVIDLRNGYIAHLVGGYEEAVPVVQIDCDSDGHASIIEVSCCASRVAGPSSFEVERFLRLAANALDVVSSAVRQEQRRLLPIALEATPEMLMEAGQWTPMAPPKGGPKKAPQ